MIKLFENLSYKLDSFRYYLRFTLYRLKNVFRWAVFIWSHKISTWDFSYSLKVLRFHLLLLKSDMDIDRHSCSKKSSKEISIAIHLLGRLADDNYIALARDTLDRAKYGRCRPVDVLDMIFSDVSDEFGFHSCSFIDRYLECGFDELDIKQQYKLEKHLRDADKELLYKLLKRKGNTWRV